MRQLSAGSNFRKQSIPCVSPLNTTRARLRSASRSKSDICRLETIAASSTISTRPFLDLTELWNSLPLALPVNCSQESRIPRSRLTIEIADQIANGFSKTNPVLGHLGLGLCARLKTIHTNKTILNSSMHQIEGRTVQTPNY
jgi:hypothetical protein